MAPPKKIDWNQAKTEYVTNPDLTLEDIASKFSVASETVRKISADENWTDERTKYEQKTYEETINRLAKEGAKHRSDIIKMALYVMAKSFRKITDAGLEPQDFNEASEVIKKMSDVVQKFLPISMKITSPITGSTSMPSELKEWYIEVAKVFAPELLDGKDHS